jgi:hypothetical protein
MITNHNMICRGPAKATRPVPFPRSFPSIMYLPQRRHRRPDADAPVAVSPSAPARRSVSARATPLRHAIHRPAGSLVVTVHGSSAVTLLMDCWSSVYTHILNCLSVFLLPATCSTQRFLETTEMAVLMFMLWSFLMLNVGTDADIHN